MRLRLVVLLAFLGVGLLAYAPVLAGPFQYDDKRVVLDPKVRDEPGAWGYGGVWGTRGLSQGSFWLDWRLWGENTVPYHIENVLIHVFAAWLVFVLLRQLGMRSWLAIFGGLVFLLHPVQSQAVAYISQRFESMAAMFYLLAVVLYLRRRWVGAWLAGMASASSKEIAITLPIILLMLEILVIRKKLRVREWLILGTFMLIPIRIGVQVIASGDFGGVAPTVGDIGRQLAVVERQEAAMTRWTYLLTQFNVVRTYLRLAVIPVGQSLDYDYPLQTGWDAKTAASLGLHMTIGAVALWAVNRKQLLVALGIAWFYVTLLPTSSVIPIRDVIYEHRLYLPLAGLVVVLASLIDRFYRQWLKVGMVGVVTVYALLTLARSSVWASDVKLWEDAWKKGPNKDRTNKNYGFVLTEAGRLREGIVRLERAVELNPEDQDYRITLGAAYLQAKDWAKAKAQFERAVELRPDKADGWNNLGVAEFQLKHYPEAKVAFETALEKDPNLYMAWLGLGGVEIVLRNFEAAEAALKQAIAIDAKAPETYKNLAILEKLRGARQEL